MKVFAVATSKKKGKKMFLRMKVNNSIHKQTTHPYVRVVKEKKVIKSFENVTVINLNFDKQMKTERINKF